MFEYLVVIYIVHDANIQLYFYIASDISKKSKKTAHAMMIFFIYLFIKFAIIHSKDRNLLK